MQENMGVIAFGLQVDDFVQPDIFYFRCIGESQFEFVFIVLRNILDKISEKHLPRRSINSSCLKINMNSSILIKF